MAIFPSPTSTWHSNTYPSIYPTRSELSAKGKTVLITGGGTGIGAGTARSFAEAGAARIAILGRRQQPLLDTKASIEHEFPAVEVFTASTDVTEKTQVDEAFAKFAGGAKIDILVSNAANGGSVDSMDSVEINKFLDCVDINIKGSLLVAKAFLQHASANAVIIDVSSGAAHMNLGARFAAYNVAKLAVYRLWDCVAAASPEMSVFHVHPGVVDTAMNREAGGVAALGYEDHVSLPGNFHVWLASPEARFLRGKFIWCNWDVDELKSRAKEIEGSEQFNIGLVGWPWKDDSWKSDVWGNEVDSSA